MILRRSLTVINSLQHKYIREIFDTHVISVTTYNARSGSALICLYIYIFSLTYLLARVRIRESVKLLAAGWTSRGSVPDGILFYMTT